MNYTEFLKQKEITDPHTGIIDLPDLAPQLNGFQRDIVRWALRRGRAAVFAGTGLGKTFMSLAWADAIKRATGHDTIILTPIAVAPQFVSEGEKFGIQVTHCKTQADVRPGINVTNYEKIEHFDVEKFGAVILDESSILKAYDGKTRTMLIELFRNTPFRLAATATPSPNDFMELGNHAEFIGAMSYTDMLSMFFTHDGGETQKWRLKGHAEGAFWRWMCSWAVMLTHPRDLGYDDAGYDLPPLRQHQHTVRVDFDGNGDTLFAIEARTLSERIKARRDTVAERVALAFKIVTDKELCDKLSCGNQNTQREGGKNITLTPKNESGGKSNHVRQKKTPNTCDNTGRRSLKNSAEQESNKIESILLDESGTRQTMSSPPNASNHQSGETQRKSEMRGCAHNSALAFQNTMICSPHRGVVAQSVVSDQPISAVGDCTSITAIQAARFAASFAGHATSVSESSGTIHPSSEWQPTTWIPSEPWFIWCNLNDEQDALERVFKGACISVRGSMSEEDKKESILAWMRGDQPIMISKPSVMGFGLNLQHCNNTIFVGLNDSFEQLYQAIRRFWRFGQTKPVDVHFIAAETEGAVVANVKRKEADAERMVRSMVHHMADLSSSEIRGSKRGTPDYTPTEKIILPNFLEVC